LPCFARGFREGGGPTDALPARYRGHVHSEPEVIRFWRLQADSRHFSWSARATSVREVSVPEMLLGNHSLINLKGSAIGLSPIGKTCGGQIDGTSGVDLLDQMGVTIDLKRRMATLNAAASNPCAQFNDKETAMGHRNAAFNLGHAEDLADCFDPEILPCTPAGEFRGRQPVMQYLRNADLKFAPRLRYDSQMHGVKSWGRALVCLRLQHRAARGS
jgi:hypothetical protein